MSATPRRLDLADMPDCAASDSARFGVMSESGRPALIPNVGYVVDNVDPPWKGQKWVMFLAILAVARMVIWETRKKRLYDGANFSLRDLILYFRHQLRV